MPKNLQEDYNLEEGIELSINDPFSVKTPRWKPHYAYEYSKCFDVAGFGGPLEYKIYSSARKATTTFSGSHIGFWNSLGWNESNLNKNNDFLRKLAGPYGAVIFKMHLQQLEEEKKL